MAVSPTRPATVPKFRAWADVDWSPIPQGFGSLLFGGALRALWHFRFLRRVSRDYMTCFDLMTRLL